MVHALDEIRRLLRPGGRLIDIHPALEAPLIEAYESGRVVFAGSVPFGDYEDVRHAADALAQIVQRRLFIIERSGEFDFLTYGSSVAELRDFLAEANAYDERPEDEAVAARKADLYGRVEAIMQVVGKGAEVAYHERGRIARFRPMR